MPDEITGRPRRSIDTVDSLNLELKDFLAYNKSANIEVSSSDGAVHAVNNPWNDDSVMLYIPTYVKKRRKALFEALNSVILPERLSAIYHRDTQTLEVIWSAYELPEPLAEVVGRAFSFTYNNVVHNCHFKTSSLRLLAIARESIFGGFSETGHRSLKSFEKLTNPRKHEDDEDDDVESSAESSIAVEEIGEPVSFFIDQIDWVLEDGVLDLIRHLNFYLKYYDSLSPTIRIHDSPKGKVYSKRGRYLEDSFPESITGKPLNSTLMSFWLAAGHGDASRRFLYYYRIIEYVAFYHLDAQAKVRMSRLLAIPNPSGNASFLTEKAIEIIREAAKPDDYARFKATVLDLVMPHHIEREAAVNADYFSVEQTFDGGYKLKPLFANITNPQLGPHGMDNFVTTLRDIRNALSHGRDQKTGHVILPTSANFNTLKPWIDLIATAAAEVVLYESMA